MEQDRYVGVLCLSIHFRWYREVVNILSCSSSKNSLTDFDELSFVVASYLSRYAEAIDYVVPNEIDHFVLLHLFEPSSFDPFREIVGHEK